MPGIRRERVGDGFRYFGVDGGPTDDERLLARIQALAIPPAWTDVWIAPTARGHIQATGRDEKGRKQYRYHPRWRAVRDETKYARMIAFAQALPYIREVVSADLGRAGLPREKVLATIVRLLDETDIRVGNAEYARENESFGLTTLENRHVEVSGSTLRFEFRGKSGKHHVAEVTDRRVARIVKRCQELPGHELFQYLDDTGEQRLVESSDVNEYLHSVTGQDFTAKDFRTWGGTVVAARTLRELGGYDSETQAKHNIVQAVKAAAEQLGNTPTICRKCYVHPSVVDAYMNGSLLSVSPGRAEQRLAEGPNGLHEDEVEVLALLLRLEREVEGAARAG
jgi:DNA topoisomerase-1